jgi:hypothetical protein
MKTKPISLIVLLFFCLCGSVHAELAPKKVFEIDLNDHTNLDVYYMQQSKTSGKDSICSILFESNISMTFWFARDKYHLLPSITGSDPVISISETDTESSECLIRKDTSIIRFLSNNGLKIYKFDYSKFNALPEDTNIAQVQSNRYYSVIPFLDKQNRKILYYDLKNWVKTEGGNSTPKIMFSKVDPNEITVKGETSKGGTIERSTDLKNWKRLVKVNKGGFEVFVDPTEKNKEFFRVKSE